MPHLSSELKLKVILLHREGKRNFEILKILKDQGKFSISRQRLADFIKRFNQTKSIQNHPKSGRTAVDVTPEVLAFIDEKTEEKDETTAPDLVIMLSRELGLNFSVTKVKGLRKKLGWLSSGTKYCQLVREANRAKRLEFSQKCLDTKETFDDVIFTDECTLALENNARLSFHRWWEPPKLKGRPKHPLKVHVWAGISRRGPTSLLKFEGIMKSEFFVESIMKDTLEPFVREVFPEGHRFQQDNDPKHTSTLAKDYYATSIINWRTTPPESPDLNPIELIWHELRHFLRKTHKPRTKKELVNGISKFWEERMTTEKCSTYIDHLKKVLPKVIEREGRASGY